ncbi:MAG: spinster family MFS transporter [Myxococcota bacterium]
MSEPGPSRAYSLWVLALLSLAYVLNFVDRQVLAIVAGDVKAELGLSDFQLGLLLGPAFVVCFTLSGFFLAHVADTRSRKWVLTAGLTVWSLLTAGCGSVAGFWQLATFRFGVGIGEAAGAPPSQSMISDYFAPAQRARALSVFGLGIYFGTLLGFAGGGVIAEWFDWRTAFVVAGLSGLPLALLIALTVREPARSEAPSETLAPFAEMLRVLTRQRTYRRLMLAAACQAFIGFAALSWSALFLQRAFGMSKAEAGVSFGLIAGIAGAAGSLLGGVLADRLAARDPRWYAWLAASVSLAAAPFFAAFARAESAALALACFGAFYFLNNIYVPSLWTLVQTLVPPRLRATSSATQLAITNLVGYGVSSVAVGFLNDRLAPSCGDDAMRWSLLLPAVIGALSGPLFYRCAASVREDLAATRTA